jgi:hypothetical protein
MGAVPLGHESIAERMVVDRPGDCDSCPASKLLLHVEWDWQKRPGPAGTTTYQTNLECLFHELGDPIPSRLANRDGKRTGRILDFQPLPSKETTMKPAIL